jgi:hypothetical protein
VRGVRSERGENLFLKKQPTYAARRGVFFSFQNECRYEYSAGTRGGIRLFFEKITNQRGSSWRIFFFQKNDF